MVIDVAELLRGEHGPGYSHEYDGYLAFFKLLAYSEKSVKCVNVPNCWTPFVYYLGHEVASVKARLMPGWEFEAFDWPLFYRASSDQRRAVEIASVCRPELVHALYCADTEWPCLRRKVYNVQEFPVTCNGSFFRPEVQDFRAKLEGFKPTKRYAVLTPCAAEKPYPSAMHRAVIARLDERFHVIVCTGVLGLVPEELWGEMPHYDSGLPNLERVSETVAWYFTKHDYDEVIVFSDFYAYAVEEGVKRMRSQHSGRPLSVRYLFGNYYRDTYENLMLPEHLHRLERAVRETPGSKGAAR